MSDFRRFSSFDVEQRDSRFRDDPSFAEMIRSVNEQLIPVQRGLEQASANDPDHPVIVVVSLPRAGSTLLTQLMPARLDVGYVSNLMARFHQAPAVGAALQQQLIGERLQKQRRFASQHGVTCSIEEPHEFGYFWARHFDVGAESHEPTQEQLATVDFAALGAELKSVSAAFGRAWSCKCSIGAGFLPVLAKLPNIFVIDLVRDELDVAVSIMRVRRARMNRVGAWWSWRPAQYARLKSLSPEAQIAGQIVGMRSCIDRGLADWPENRRAVIHYEALIADPEQEMLALRDKLAHFAACPPRAVGEPLHALRPRRLLAQDEERREVLGQELAVARDLSR
jgi:hypothetical protein